MKFLLEINKPEALHHFYIIEDFDFEYQKAKEHLSLISSYQNTFIEFSYQNITTDEARLLTELFSRKVSPDQRIFYFIKADQINTQAQNVLLKSFEEPVFGTHFFLILPNVANILPTFASRAIVAKKTFQNAVNIKPEIFSMDISKRMDFVEKLLDQIKQGKKSKQDAILLMDNIINYLNQQNNYSQAETLRIKAVITLRDFMHDNSPSLKSILEFAVLATGE